MTTSTARGLVSKGPARREAITRAATRVLRTSGIEGLTHRAVAEEAGVPLGSTTYYFTSRADLLNAAIEYSTDTNIRWLQEWAAANADTDITVTLPRMLHEYLTEHRAVAVLDIEVYVLAARRPELRVHTSRWTASFIDLLTAFVDRDVATYVAATFNGLILRAVASDLPTQPTELARVLGRALRA
jgi:TetR/AcrR family transcriptional regulator, regulator of biofilm formation and stress response